MLGLSHASQLCIYQCLTALIWNFARFVLSPLYRRGRLHGHAADNTNEETAMTMASALVHRQSQTLVADTSG